MKLIDGDAMLDVVFEWCEKDFPDLPSARKELLRMIADRPEVDAEHVVYCGKCKHHAVVDGKHACVKDADWDEEMHYWTGFISYLNLATRNPFCSDGDPKD